jgi:hypothetical protein
MVGASKILGASVGADEMVGALEILGVSVGADEMVGASEILGTSEMVGKWVGASVTSSPLSSFTFSTSENLAGITSLDWPGYCQAMAKLLPPSPFFIRA